MVLANCGPDGCPPVPLWISVPIGVVGALAILVVLFSRRR